MYEQYVDADYEMNLISKETVEAQKYEGEF